MNKSIYVLIIASYVCTGCNSIQKHYISTTSSPEAPHAILLIGNGKKKSFARLLAPNFRARSELPAVLSINEERPRPCSFWHSFLFGGIYHYRIPTGEVRVKAYFPRKKSGDAIGGAIAAGVVGYLEAKERGKAPVYVFYAEDGLVYRAVANPHKYSVLIIDEKSGCIVAPTFEDVLPLLKSGDYADTRAASKTVYEEAMQASKELADAYADIIITYLSRPDEDEIAVDAMAWVCKAIGSAQIKENIEEIEKLINADVSVKIKKHAEDTLKLIKN